MNESFGARLGHSGRIGLFGLAGCFAYSFVPDSS